MYINNIKDLKYIYRELPIMVGIFILPFGTILLFLYILNKYIGKDMKKKSKIKNKKPHKGV